MEHQLFFALRGGQWNIPILRELVEGILPKHSRIEDLEVDHEFAGIGRRQLLINARQVRSNGGPAEMILLAFEDITARKRTDEALRQSESTVTALLESAAQAILAANEDGKIVRANGVTAKMFGYDQDELIGQSVEILIPENLRQSLVGRYKDFFTNPQTRQMGTGFEIEGRRKDGTLFPTEVSLGFIDTPTGKLATGFVSDITRRKRLEKAAETSGQEIRALAANLLTVQEEERRRVSRELHDDLCQQLASLAFDMGGLAADLPTPEAARNRLRGLQIPGGQGI